MLYQARFFILVLFLTIIQFTVNAQSFSSIASILNNMKKNFDTTFHFSSLSSINATPISPHTYLSSLAQYNFSSNTSTYNNSNFLFETSINTSVVFSNLGYLITTNQRLDEVLEKELIGASVLLQMRAQPWKLPFNIGFHIGSLPINLGNMQLHWYSIGANIHYTLFEQDNLWRPTLSTMVVYSYSYFGIHYPLSTVEIKGIDNLNSDFRVKLESPALQLDTNIHSFAWRFIINRTWNNINPFLLLEPAIYMSNVTIETDGIIYLSEDRGKTYTKETSLKGIAGHFLDRNGLNDSQSSIKGSLQLIGGTQFSIALTKLTVQLGIDFISFYTTGGISVQF